MGGSFRGSTRDRSLSSDESIKTAVAITARKIGQGYPPFVVAELSANHGSSLNRAFSIMEAAKKAGADAVKLQTYTADTITIDHDAADFLISGGLWNGRRLYELYQEAHTPWEWHPELFAKGRQLGLTVFSTPFDATAVDLLEKLEAPAYKIASFELVDLPLIARVAATGKPTIVSTGMASPEEIAEAVTTFRSAGGRELLLLHCVSGYPTPASQSNLRRIVTLSQEFGCPVGLSDHTLGVEVAIAAVALGACLIEKHFTLRRSDGGPDAAFSLEPQELSQLVHGARTAYEALGTGEAARAEVEKSNIKFRRSIYVVKDIPSGGFLTSENIRIIRPGFGLAPKHLPDVLGKRARRALTRGTALSWDAIE
jgi:pseudaminic acid synthase